MQCKMDLNLLDDFEIWIIIHIHFHHTYVYHHSVHNGVHGGHRGVHVGHQGKKLFRCIVDVCLKQAQVNNKLRTSRVWLFQLSF